MNVKKSKPRRGVWVLPAAGASLSPDPKGVPIRIQGKTHRVKYDLRELAREIRSLPKEAPAS